MLRISWVPHNLFDEHPASITEQKIIKVIFTIFHISPVVFLLSWLNQKINVVDYFIVTHSIKCLMDLYQSRSMDNPRISIDILWLLLSTNLIMAIKEKREGSSGIEKISTSIQKKEPKNVGLKKTPSSLFIP